MTGTKLHEVWKEMKRRCQGNYYGTRIYKEKGIKVCEEWQDAGLFIEWALRAGYKEGLQIDRINNDGDYCPKNCRWVTSEENAANRSTTRRIKYKGESLTYKEWGIRLGINPHSLSTRIKRGWSIERALTTKIQKRKK